MELPVAGLVEAAPAAEAAVSLGLWAMFGNRKPEAGGFRLPVPARPGGVTC